MVESSVAETFPRQLRLTTGDDFRQVFSHNIRIAGGSITILVNTHAGKNPRIGFAVSKKQITKAVYRNRLKRVFRESFRKYQHRLPRRDMVIMVRKQILLSDSKQLQASIEKHWNSIIKRCEKS